MVTNVALFKYHQFKDLVVKATKELESRVSQDHHNSWRKFCKRIQGAIKLVGTILEKKTLTIMDDLSKRF